MLGQVEQSLGAIRLPDMGSALDRHPVAAAQEDRLAIDVEAKALSRRWPDPSAPA